MSTTDLGAVVNKHTDGEARRLFKLKHDKTIAFALVDVAVDDCLGRNNRAEPLAKVLQVIVGGR